MAGAIRRGEVPLVPVPSSRQAKACRRAYRGTAPSAIYPLPLWHPSPLQSDLPSEVLLTENDGMKIGAPSISATSSRSPKPIWGVGAQC